MNFYKAENQWLRKVERNSKTKNFLKMAHRHAIRHPSYNNMPLFRNNPMLSGNNGMLFFLLNINDH